MVNKTWIPVKPCVPYKQTKTNFLCSCTISALLHALAYARLHCVRCDKRSKHELHDLAALKVGLSLLPHPLPVGTLVCSLMQIQFLKCPGNNTPRLMLPHGKQNWLNTICCSLYSYTCVISKLFNSHRDLGPRATTGLPWVWGFPWGFPWGTDCDESPWVLWVICGDELNRSATLGTS